MDLELWARLRSVFDARKLPEGRRRGKNLRMLAPVMTCATCEAPMWMSSDRGKLFARCSTNIHKLRVDDKCPTPASVKYDNLEALVLDLIEDEAKERPVVVMQRPGSDPMAVRSAEDALEAAQARLRAAQTEEEEADALSSRRAARATLEALSNATGAPVLRLTGERVWDVLMGEDIDAAARAMQQVLDRVVVTPGGGRGRKTLDPARVSLEWADYVEPGPTKPRTLTRGGKIVNQAELDRYAQATAEGV
ncbi:recombinase zinc beta ribbon domain-containing protein [Promicromonospora sp. NPDC023987]|uniref:recombinase zinc beta ribbon domain-containing protein n=1 Tax=Promicromonospora sp. NPDC023987 TaxID=3155360 RepID=UPI0033C92B6A